jgi:YHS domain-containing protein
MKKNAHIASVSIAVLLSFAASSGCATPEQHGPSWFALAQGHARCPVCDYEGDLACIDVTVEPGTPSTDWNGTTYYFCSWRCRRDFERTPEKYVHR